MSVDVRTRIDGEVPSVSPSEFFDDILPDRFRARRAALAGAIRHYALAPLTIEVGPDSWTLSAETNGIDVRRGPSSTAMRLQLAPSQVDDLARDQATPMAWHASGTLRLDGELHRLLDWWLFVRGTLDEFVPHVPGDAERMFPDGHRHRSFRLGDDTQAQRRFLESAGYLHLEGVYSTDEMKKVSEDMDRAAPDYHPGDGRSWWAKTADGTTRLVRMQGFDEVSPTVGALVRNDRLAAIGAIAGAGHVWGTMPDNRIEALIKPLAVVSGISDVPWHKDCSLGRHSYDCCSLTVGISVTGADAETGQLGVVAGSHRALMWPARMRDDLDLPRVELPTRTGDVTVHLSCTLHMAQPPVTGERRVMYTSFRLPPKSDDAIGKAQLRSVREKASVTVSQPSAAKPGA